VSRRPRLLQAGHGFLRFPANLQTLGRRPFKNLSSKCYPGLAPPRLRHENCLPAPGRLCIVSAHRDCPGGFNQSSRTRVSSLDEKRRSLSAAGVSLDEFVTSRSRIGDDVFRQRRRRRTIRRKNWKASTDIARGDGDVQGAEPMMTWRRSARPTAAISDPAIGRIKTKRSSDRHFNCKQRGSPSGVHVAGTMPHAAAPPGA
jgi:hypothetical protein